MSYDIDGDLNAIQDILINNTEILTLMGLSSATHADIVKRIIKRSKYGDLANGEIRLCIFFAPSRGTSVNVMSEEVIEIDCHVPDTLDYKARQIIGKIVNILFDKKVNGHYMKCKGQLGELPTVTNYYCHGVKLGYYRTYL
jgi:hypothetical protein